MLVEDAAERAWRSSSAASCSTSSSRTSGERRLANIQRKTRRRDGRRRSCARRCRARSSATEVEVGAVVKRGQGLVILSAMKMENEIRSPRDGQVVAVHVSEGDKVDQNADLVTIGPVE